MHASPRTRDGAQGVMRGRYWYEAQDGGDPKAEVEHRDVAFTLDVDEEGSEPAELLRTAWRVQGITWCSASIALVRESEWKTRRVRLWQVPCDPTSDAWPLSSRCRPGVSFGSLVVAMAWTLCVRLQRLKCLSPA